MKKSILLLIAMLLIYSGYSQGILFHTSKFEDVINLAKKENKAIFIDVYTTWCGPCKALSKDIFPQLEVGEFFNKNYISFKTDAENSEDGKMIAKRYDVTAYPTLLFINSDGELVYRFLGYRDIKGILKEGALALTAFNMFPTIKKLNTEYDAGNRSIEFLNEYYLALDKSGLDCGKVLVDYFNLLSDSEIIDSLNVGRIAKITVYDKHLSDRIVEIAIKVSKDKSLPKKQESSLNRSIGKFMSACLTSAAKQGSVVEFEEILELKERFFTIPSNINSITTASLGGGNIYVPSELLRLNFYASIKQGEKFVSVYEDYLNTLIKEHEESKESRELLEKGLKEKLDAAIKSGDEKELSNHKKISGMMSLFVGVNSYYISANMINNIEKYANFYTGEKNVEFIDKIEANYMFFNEYYPSCKIAVYVAEKLIEMGKTKSAHIVLTLALEKGQQAMEVTEVEIGKCKLMLEELSK